MSPSQRFSHLVQSFFFTHLMQQRDVSAQTLGAYRDTFRLLLPFLKGKCGKAVHQLTLGDLSANNLILFLKYLEDQRGNCVRTRNCRLAALRSFFHYVGAVEGPEVIGHVQRIMAIPQKRFVRPMLGFLSVEEMQAILQTTGPSWSGQRDHLLFLFLYRMSSGTTTEPCNSWARDANNAWFRSGRKRDT